MRKTKRTDTSISLGGIALNTLYQAAKAGNLTAAIYILEHPGIGHIDVYEMLHGRQQGVNRLQKKLNEFQNKKEEINEDGRR